MSDRDGNSQQQPATQDDAAFAAMLRDSLRASERSLDAETLAKLRESRARAVAAAARPAGFRWPWTVALPAACAAAFAGWIALNPATRTAAPAATSTASVPIEMLDLLGSEDAPLTDDDVDFVHWLDEASEHG